MSTHPASLSNSGYSDEKFFRRSVFRSFNFWSVTILLALVLLDGGLVLSRHRLDAIAAFGAVVVMVVPLVAWLRIFHIHRGIRKLTAGPQSSEMVAVLQILAGTLFSTMVLLCILLLLALQFAGNAPHR